MFFARFLVVSTVFVLLLVESKLILLMYTLHCLMSFTSWAEKAYKATIVQSQTAATVTASSLAELAFVLAVPAWIRWATILIPILAESLRSSQLLSILL